MTTSAKERYTLLATQRHPFLDRARECAKLTIPALMPPSGHTGYQKLPTPWQALGARCVNQLGARLLLTLFPPSTPFFKLSVDDLTLERLAGKGKRGTVDKALNKVERAISEEIETSAMRPALNEVLKHLVSAGNILVFMPDTGSIRCFRLDRYVVKRDPMGAVLEIVTHEKISAMELPAAAQPLVAPGPGGDVKKASEDSHDLYTHVRRTADGWSVSQELNGKAVPGSEGTYPKDKSPWLALRLTAIDNEDYGRGLVEEYLGDFKSLEALTKAITQGAAAAAKVLFLVKPTGTTQKRVVAQSESGAVMSGNADDVTVLQLQKHADFQVAKSLRDSLREDLAYAFLLNSAIQRNGERVTAEEIRYMAQELETGLGGIYANLSQELQLALVSLLMHRLERQGRLPPLPKKFVKPSITTGLDAIGRGNDRTKIAAFIADLVALEARPDGIVSRNVNEQELVTRLGAGHGIEMDGLIKTAEEISDAELEKKMTAMIEKLGPNIINAAGKQAPGK